MKDQFQGLPMEQLIGAPLSAICDGQAMLAASMRDYIESVGLDENRRIRMLDFTFQRPLTREEPDGSVSQVLQDYKVSVPFIALVSVPTLQVESANIDFTMEVKAALSSELPEQDGSQLPLKDSLKPRQKSTIVGAVTRHKTDSTSTYQVSLQAKQMGTPEGLSRLFDILHLCIAPLEVGEARPINKD
ncbi:DUF2589 domain-containing protein [Gallaecimonas kandeliae]|uniref:DUF2589 domain-containing protein n=1 Tax=Gallaecimonas kandeliae TaxID=3029055 RepID=UPI00264771EE|nr:DUF2589 domain-containing protein [Gallaecimonas kandeliae]WKE64077.1 DUF2589 domain-containing protein [Gallaecimonas kandeliae]